MTDRDSVETLRGAPRSWRRWLWPILIGSIALNLLIAGAVIGMWLNGSHHGGRGGHAVLRHVPEAQRETVRAILKSHRAKVRPLRLELRSARREMVEYLRSETIDEAELNRRLDAIDNGHANVRKQLRPLIVELSKTLEPDVRARILRRFLGGPRRGRRHRQRH